MTTLLRLLIAFFVIAFGADAYATNYTTSSGVQQFTVIIQSGATTGSQTLPKTLHSGAFILWGGMNPSVANDPAEDFAYLSLSGSTITATRTTGTAGTITIYGSVVDGDTTNLIKSVQIGTIALSTSQASNTASISPVTNANTAVHLLGWASANTTISVGHEGPVLSLSGTTLTVTRPASTGALTVGYEIIEFQPGALNQSVQNINATSSSSVTTYTVSGLNAVVLNNSLCIYGGSSIGTVTTDLAEYKQYGALASTTSFTVHVNTGVADAKTYNCSLVEFKAGVLNSAVQRSTTTLTGVVSNTTTLTAVNEAYAGLNWAGNTTTSITAVAQDSEGAAVLTVTQPAVIQRVGAFNISTSSLVITSASSTAGSLLAVAVNSLSNTVTVSGVTDNMSQTWVQVPGAQAQNTTANVGASDVWYFPNSASGVTTITITLSSAVELEAVVYEVSGIATSSPVDVVGVVNTQASSATATGPTITTTAPGDFILAGSGGTGNVSSAQFPYIADGVEAQTAYYVWPTVVTTTPVLKYSGAATYCMSVVAFKAAAANDLALVTKNNATNNITGAWEIFELPAYVTPGGAAAIDAIWFGSPF